jgi:hypothetical protein
MGERLDGLPGAIGDSYLRSSVCSVGSEFVRRRDVLDTPLISRSREDTAENASRWSRKVVRTGRVTDSDILSKNFPSISSYA